MQQPIFVLVELTGQEIKTRIVVFVVLVPLLEASKPVRNFTHLVTAAIELAFVTIVIGKSEM